MAIEFVKFHGFGNDYLVLLRDALCDSIEIDSLAAAMCDRHAGIGADGLAILEKRDTETSNYFCEIVNPDGSTAGFSGNGTRCAAAFLYHAGLFTDNELRLETRSGVKNYSLLEGRDGGEFWFEAEIGKPRFASDEIPVASDARLEAVVNEPITLGDCHYAMSAVNVGNPVACIFVDDFNFDWKKVGREMETHEKFPERANIVFVKTVDRENIELRIWERGAGETSASGTCASAAAVLSAFLLKTGRHVFVQSEGGTTDILWRDDDEIVIKGSAAYVFSGEWPTAADGSRSEPSA